MDARATLYAGRPLGGTLPSARLPLPPVSSARTHQSAGIALAERVQRLGRPVWAAPLRPVFVGVVRAGQATRGKSPIVLSLLRRLPGFTFPPAPWVRGPPWVRPAGVPAAYVTILASLPRAAATH